MAQQHGLPSDALDQAEQHTASYQRAQILSRVLHPIPLNILLFLVVGFYGFADRRFGLAWAGICLLLQVLPPTVFFTIRARQGVYSDEDVSDRRQRNELYIFGMVTVLVGILLLLPFGLPRQFLALLLCALLCGVICGVINIWWKISVHAGSIATTATVSLLYAPRLGIALWLCALALGWARVRTHNHTALQVLAGFVVATLIVLAVFQVVV